MRLRQYPNANPPSFWRCRRRLIGLRPVCFAALAQILFHAPKPLTVRQSLCPLLLFRFRQYWRHGCGPLLPAVLEILLFFQIAALPLFVPPQTVVFPFQLPAPFHLQLVQCANLPDLSKTFPGLWPLFRVLFVFWWPPPSLRPPLFFATVRPLFVRRFGCQFGAACLQNPPLRWPVPPLPPPRPLLF